VRTANYFNFNFTHLNGRFGGRAQVFALPAQKHQSRPLQLAGISAKDSGLIIVKILLLYHIFR
jgi:hypothetical protein